MALASGVILTMAAVAADPVGPAVGGSVARDAVQESRSAALRLWGVDASDGSLFVIDEPGRERARARKLGRIVDGQGNIIGGELLDGLAISPDRSAVIASQARGSSVARLLRVDLTGVATGERPVAVSIGELHLDAGQHVAGIVGDPLFGTLYAVISDGDAATVDELYAVRLGTKGMFVERRRRLGSRDGRRSGSIRAASDIAVGPGGDLLITDDATGSLFRVNAVDVFFRGVSPVDTGINGAVAYENLAGRTALVHAAGDRIVLMSGEGETIREIDLAGEGIARPVGLAFALDVDPRASGFDVDSAFPFEPIRTTPPINRPARYGGGGFGGGGGGGGRPRGGAQELTFDPPTGREPFDRRLLFPENGDPPGGPEEPFFEDPPEEPRTVSESPGGVPSPGAAALAGVAAVLVGSRRRRG
ncbi:MAG: hypothetical protein AAGI17_03795 [Planctomycetota bacterium]